MEKIELDNNMRISRIGLGAWAMGGWMWGGTDANAAIETSAAPSIAASP